MRIGWLPLQLHRRVAAAYFTTFVAVALTACSGGGNGVDFQFHGATPHGTTIPPAKRKPAGDVTAKYLANGTGSFSLTSVRGQVVVLNYWGSWCSPCVAETPVFDRIYRQVRADGVTFVGIDTRDTASAGKAFVTDNDISYPMLDDQLSHTALQLGRLPMFALPNTILVDRQGRVAAVYVGPVQAGDLSPVLTALISEK